MLDLTVTDENLIDVGNVQGYEFVMSVGGENSFDLTVGPNSQVAPANKGLVYITGTDYGGMVVSRRVDSSSGIVMFSGRTWYGILNRHVISPSSGNVYHEVSGEANAVLLSLIEHMGLGDLFSASVDDSGIQVSHQFRFDRAYDGIVQMLSESSAKLKITWDGTKAVLRALPIVQYSDIDSDQSQFVSEEFFLPVNHLVCIGGGEGADRIEIHLFADGDGEISNTQSLFGKYEVTDVLETTTGDETELEQEGRAKLAELQCFGTVESSFDLSFDYDLGDTVCSFDVATGASVTATVTSKTITIVNGTVSVDCEVGDVSVTSGSDQVSTSSGSGGIVYSAGDNISIVGRTISADVGLDDIAQVDSAASAAYALASDAAAAAGAAQQAASGNVSAVSAASPIEAERDGQGVSLSHAASGVSAGSYGPASNLTPAWGDTVTIPPRVSVNATGHVTKLEGRTFRVPSSAATPSAAGLMSAADKDKLDGVEAGANAYDHPASAAGAKAFGLYKVATDADGHVTAATAVEKADITAMGIPGQDTTYADMSGATSSKAGARGLVPAPAAGKQASYLRGDGSWAVPTNTTYGNATQSSAGLMSASDKEKLDGIDAGADKTTVDSALSATSGNPVANKAVKAALDDKADADHTHNYAGSSSEGGAATTALECTGNAATASKLAEPVTIAISGAVTGSATFDGSKDVTINVEGNIGAAGFLAAHPVNTYLYATPDFDPSVYGGTWERVPKIGPNCWIRKG